MKLFAIGLGYTALHLARTHPERFTGVGGTVRSPEKAQALRAEGIAAHVFPTEDEEARSHLRADLSQAEALLLSAPPEAEGDPVLAALSDVIAAAPNLGWIGYLSTIGVYPDQGGGWVDENTPPDAGGRGARRAAAERAWLDLGGRTGKAVQIFRLGGIYGPGRNPFVQLAAGTARRIVKPGQVFNRIHVADIAAVLAASLDRPRPGAVYNVVDDAPSPPQDVVAFAAELAGVTPPPEIPFEKADLSPMGRAFYGANKRVRNRLIREELGVSLRYPTYRDGLSALHGTGDGV